MKGKKDCKECKGTGNIRFYFDCDSTRTVKCPKCFPDKKPEYDKTERSFMDSYDYDW